MCLKCEKDCILSAPVSVHYVIQLPNLVRQLFSDYSCSLAVQYGYNGISILISLLFSPFFVIVHHRDIFNIPLAVIQVKTYPN